MVKKDTMLRFWCQKVLPLVYDDSLSYYELLNKVVLHLNQHTEDINALIDFYDTFAEDVEDIIRQMMADGDFNEIVADTIGSLIAEEYDPTKSYIIFDYCIYESKLYRANGSTTGDFDPEKWVERTVGYDLTTIQNYIYSLNAGNVSFDGSATYAAGTVGKEIKDIKANLNDIDAEEVAFDSSETYSNGTVGKELKDLKSEINNLAPTEIDIAAPSDTLYGTERVKGWKSCEGIITLESNAVTFESGTESGWRLLGTLPVGVRPSEPKFGIAYGYDGTGIRNTYAIRLTTAGSIQIMSVANSTPIYFSMTYV